MQLTADPVLKPNPPVKLHLQHLSNLELLGRLVGTRKARRVYKGALQPLFAAEPDPGSPQEKCAVAAELVQRYLAEDLKSQSVLTSPRVVADYLRIALGSREHEVFVVLFLDAQHRVISVEEMFRGTLTQTAVHPREVVKAALRENAATVILAHNHPSGIAQPSRADEMLTRQLKEALALVDVRVVDHIIVAGNLTLSFAERGLL